MNVLRQQNLQQNALFLAQTGLTYGALLSLTSPVNAIVSTIAAFGLCELQARKTLAKAKATTPEASNQIIDLGAVKIRLMLDPPRELESDHRLMKSLASICDTAEITAPKLLLHPATDMKLLNYNTILMGEHERIGLSPEQADFGLAHEVAHITRAHFSLRHSFMASAVPVLSTLGMGMTALMTSFHMLTGDKALEVLPPAAATIIGLSAIKKVGHVLDRLSQHKEEIICDLKAAKLLNSATGGIEYFKKINKYVDGDQTMQSAQKNIPGFGLIKNIFNSAINVLTRSHPTSAVRIGYLEKFVPVKEPSINA